MQVTGYRMTTGRPAARGRSLGIAVVARVRVPRRKCQKHTYLREMAHMSVAETTVLSAAETAEPSTVEADAAAAAANPALLGLPTFIVGAVALGLFLIGYQPAGATAALLSIIVLSTGLGQLLATLWAVRLGAGPVAAIFGIFSGFWLTLASVLYGITHAWFGPAATLPGTLTVFALSWLVVVVLLTLASLRLPLAFTVLFGLVDLALLLVFLFAQGGATNTGLEAVAGVVVFAFTVLGMYLFFDAMGVATGGRALPLGRPVIKA
jgi:succinate-acetate transporter protein